VLPFLPAWKIKATRNKTKTSHRAKEKKAGKPKKQGVSAGPCLLQWLVFQLQPALPGVVNECLR